MIIPSSQRDRNKDETFPDEGREKQTERKKRKDRERERKKRKEGRKKEGKVERERDCTHVSVHKVRGLDSVIGLNRHDITIY